MFFSILIIIGLIFGPPPNSQQSSAKCLAYGEPVALQGKIQRVTFPGPPNYESVDDGDRPEIHWVIDLAARICTDKNEENDAEKGVGTIQLVFPDGEKDYERFKPFVGRKVEVTGKLFHAQTGHHHTSVLIEVTGIKQVG